LILYHFTPGHLLHGCLSEGLTRGCIPLEIRARGAALLPGWQWLTTSPSWQQAWNVRETITYDRAAYRLAIKVPKSARRQLYRWVLVCEQIAPRSWRDLNSAGDPENWYVYRGRVRPSWVRRVDARPVCL
jgi:hypothetical protein